MQVLAQMPGSSLADMAVLFAIENKCLSLRKVVEIKRRLVIVLRKRLENNRIGTRRGSRSVKMLNQQWADIVRKNIMENKRLNGSGKTTFPFLTMWFHTVAILTKGLVMGNFVYQRPKKLIWVEVIIDRNSVKVLFCIRSVITKLSFSRFRNSQLQWMLF